MTRTEKMEFVRRCHDAVVEDICETQSRDWGDPVVPHTRQIITDFKVEAILYEYMTEEEFDTLYSECDRLATLAACACC